MHRPASGKGTPVQVRLQPDMLTKVDEFAAIGGRSRPDVIRAMIQAVIEIGGLDAVQD
ncbi:ribbon-helix-helix domain-containing protein [Brevundimonas diminuta]|uniref:ribbon-helix-helix domain-containing protein n=1 Tax=Brevundimonas diminuta TaxID=293 RepID=UPI003D9A22F8